MNKNILAIAIAAAVAAPSVFANATAYGNAHVSVNSFSGVANGGTTASSTGLSSNSSYIGLKGSEDLAGGMKGVYQVEMQVALDGNNGSGNATEGVNGQLRNSFAGIGGGFGTVLAGRHDSLIKMSGRKYDLFGDQIGNNRNALSNANGLSTATTSFVVDGRHNNVLAYVSPTWSGFHFGVAYVPGDAVNQTETYSNTADAKKSPAVTAIADYSVGSFSVTAGYINVAKAADNVGAGGTGDVTAYRLGGGYTFGAAKVVALYQQDNILNQVTGGAVKDRGTYGLGGTYAIGAGTLKAQVYSAGNVAKNGAANNGAMLTTVGYDYALSKNTTAYAVYALADNAKAGVYSIDTTGSGTGSNQTAIAGKDNSAFAVGLQHKF